MKNSGTLSAINSACHIPPRDRSAATTSCWHNRYIQQLPDVFRRNGQQKSGKYSCCMFQISTNVATLIGGPDRSVRWLSLGGGGKGRGRHTRPRGGLVNLMVSTHVLRWSVVICLVRPCALLSEVTSSTLTRLSSDNSLTAATSYPLPNRRRGTTACTGTR